MHKDLRSKTLRRGSKTFGVSVSEYFWTTFGYLLERAEMLGLFIFCDSKGSLENVCVFVNNRIS